MNVDATSATPRRARLPHGFALFSVLGALLLTLLLEALDQTVVGLALPRIVGTLQGFEQYAWIVAAYTLASATMVPTVGKLSDQFGRKWFLVAGTIVFLAGSALAGTSQSMEQLIAFRALQGLGAGVGIALVFTVIGDIFPPSERARWQGILGIVYGFSSVVGPSLGGWLTDHGPLVGALITDATRWRWVFYVNLPIGILAVAALIVYLPADISARSSRHSDLPAWRRIDFGGALLAATASVGLLLGLTWGSNAIYAWGSPQVVGALGVALILWVLFGLGECRAVEPILPLDLFRNQVFAAAGVLSLLQMMAMVGLIVYMPLFLQGVLGASATHAGEMLTPLTLSTVVGATLAGFVVAVRKRYQAVTIVGACMMAVGVFMLATVTPTTELTTAVIYMVVAGIGIGTFFAVLMLASQNALPRSQLGIGTATIRYLGQLGAVLGVAIVGAVVNGTLANDILARLPTDTVRQLTPAGLEVATNPQVLVSPAYRDNVVHMLENLTRQTAAGPATANTGQGVQDLLPGVFEALRMSLAVAIQHGMVAILVFCAVAVVATFFLKDLPMVASSESEL